MADVAVGCLAGNTSAREKPVTRDEFEARHPAARAIRVADAAIKAVEDPLVEAELAYQLELREREVARLLSQK